MAKRVLIVGGGIMGLCVARSCVKAGFEVELFEQDTIPNPRGSSVDQHRLIRYPYGAKHKYAAMVGAAYEAWDRLWEDLGVSYYHPTGTLALDTTGNTWFRDSVESMQQLKMPFDLLSALAIEERFPYLHSTDIRQAMYLKSGGVLLAEKIVSALARWLRAHGAILHESTLVTRIDERHSQIEIDGGSKITGDHLVIAAGAWISSLMPKYRNRIIPSRQLALYMDPPNSLLATWKNAPMILDIDPQAGFYLVPPVVGTDLKIGDHRFSLRGHPDDNLKYLESEWKLTITAAATRIRGFEVFELLKKNPCFYIVRPQEDFLIQSIKRCHILTGFSGHGFKFSSLLGEQLAGKLLYY